MAGAWTNRGKYLTLDYALDGASRPSNFYLALGTATTTPNEDTNVMGDITEIAAGSGYSAGGQTVTFDTHTEDDALDRASINVADEGFLASGGSLPASGLGARWAFLTDDNATVSLRQVLAYFDLGSAITISDGQTLTIQDATLRLDKP